jgi:hypothetical protein
VNPSDAFPIIFGDAIFGNTNATVSGGVYSATESLSTSFTATTASSITITGIANTATAYFGGPLVVGQLIVGPGIPSGATIASIVSATSITLSAAATASATITMTVLSPLLVPSNFIGVAVREVKTAETYYTDGNPPGATSPVFGYYYQGQSCDGLERGSCSVLVRVGTGIAPWGQVYLRVALNSAIPAGVVGGFEAQADASGTTGFNTIALPTTQFTTGVLDSNNVAEISMLTRNRA